MAKKDNNDLREILEQIRAQLGDLAGRVAKLEGKPAAAVAAAAAPVKPEEQASTPAAPELPEPVSEEIVLVIAATVAALFGERAHVRQIRLLGSPAWAQQGRVSIQASHRLY